MIRKRIYIFTHFPPPVHGFSNVNQFVHDKLSAEGSFEVIKFSFIKNNKNKAIFYLNRLLRSFYAIYLILTKRRNPDDIFYMPVSGGAGMIFEILPWMLAGIVFKKRIMHHHSFQYLHKKSPWMGWMQKMNTANIHHIFLCYCHYEGFAKHYAVVKNNVSVIGNEMLLADLDHATVLNDKDDKATIVIGHLSNLSVEKGFNIFCELINQFDDIPEIKFELAGPAADPVIMQQITTLSLKYQDRFAYRGGLYGKQKEQWYKNLNFFIFPSVYKNETFPLVITEAILLGAIPLSTDIACMPEFNHTDFVFPPDVFIKQAAELIRNACNNAAYYNELKNKLNRTQEIAISRGNNELTDLMRVFKN